MLPEENQALKRYKELYSKYVESRVGLHNYHITFTNFLGHDSSVGVRKCITEMAKIEKELRAACREAYLENVAWEKSQKKIRKQQKNRNTSGLKKRKLTNDVDIQQ